MKTRLLRYLRCPHCQSAELGSHAFKTHDSEIESGLIICQTCRVWYPITETIPIVSTNPLLVEEIKKEMRAVWGHEFDFKNLVTSRNAASDQTFALTQREQIEHYNEEAVRYDAEIADTVFWRSVVDQTICQWARSEKVREGIILEIGCGTGASTVKLAKMGCRLIALDICLTAAKRALAKVRDQGLGENVDLLVTEAESLPFRHDIFTASVFTGVLHHVASPSQVLKEMSRVLKSGGWVYGHENNASAFRFLFDLMMKMKQLWHEEAGTHPLLESKKTKEWGRQAGLDIQTDSIVFLPPHFFNLLSQRTAQKLLRMTNKFFGWIPWLKDQGGLLIISGIKTGPA
ncbi:MAG TPA: methyltransferase domain-containing protein [Candidatus Omnitrophota bacterium]|nr:methyltransferase domain-containing protein [Candidatus Omnitrophota bacterium]